MARPEARWGAVKRLVEEALDLPASRRMAYLHATGAEPELRTAAIRLLRACEEAADSPVFQMPAIAFAGGVLDEVDELEEPAAGRQIEEGEPAPIDSLRAALAGRYAIEEEVGRGGMATIYRALDVRHGRRVALKVLRPGIAADEGPARFQREIEIAAGLSHPHILPLYDSGAAGDLFFYVTPFVDGESLSERLRRSGPPALGESVRLLRDVARALSYAHRQGLVHLDIKPANILLNADGDPLVADFGVAIALAASRMDGRRAGGDAPEEDPAPAETASDHDDARADSGADSHVESLVLGTPAYMAPEQIVGAPGVDRRADLYALGVVAYELLTGKTPFGRRARHEHLEAHLSEDPEPIGTLRPEMPPALADLVDRLLEKRPDDRPTDVAEVLEVLEDVLATQGAGGFIRTSVSEAPARRGTRNAEAYRLFLKGRHLLGTRQRDAVDSALRDFHEAARLDPRFARAFAGIADAWIYLSIFGYARPHDAIPKARKAAERSLELDPALVDGRAALAHILVVYAWDWKAAESALRRAIALDPTYSVLRMYCASFLHSVGRSDEALEQLDVAGRLDPVGQTGILRGRVLVDTHRPDEAIDVLLDQVELDPRRDLAHQFLAHAYLQKGMQDEALASIRRAAELSGPRDTTQLAYVHARVGDGAEARRVLGQVLNDGAPAATLGFHFAMAYGALGQSDDAFGWLEAAYEERASFMNLLGVATGFESLRSDPRFTHLLVRMGLQ